MGLKYGVNSWTCRYPPTYSKHVKLFKLLKDFEIRKSKELLTKRFRAVIKHTNVSQTKFKKPNSQR